MIKYLISILLSLCPFSLMISCETNRNKSTNYDLKNNQSRDTVVKDIPMDKNGKPRSYYKNKEVVEKIIGLESLENGFDSIQIRIWHGYAFNDTSQLIVFKKNQGNWFGEFFTLIYKYNEKGDSILSINKSVVKREPKSGWEVLMKKMLSLDILTLPDYKEIPNYLQVADGDAVIFEIATQKVYRIYSYQAPNLNKFEHQQAMKIEKVLKLIEDEFNFIQLRI